ncbi:OmpA family protein [uncultured Desulfobacter sp.]|uniref:OmpA family protein n=1 Tax=uncultured Desulfobacter sp. TaxID=240139 RepID=UPI002AA6F408|nr:OmpA family protein [uncultured Desulfobacter sp.]
MLKINCMSRVQSAIMIIVLVLGVGVFYGCGTKTTVVLLPEPDGTVGQVTVSGQDRSRLVLDKAFESASVGTPGKAVRDLGIMDGDRVEKIFGRALAFQPEMVKAFILYFQSGKTLLTPESKALIDDILNTIRQRNSRDISVVGHTDRVGNADKNYELAKKRSIVIARILMDKGVDPDLIEITSHGEANPIVPTPDTVAEPRNRRVEVMIR